MKRSRNVPIWDLRVLESHAMKAEILETKGEYEAGPQHPPSRPGLKDGRVQDLAWRVRARLRVSLSYHDPATRPACETRQGKVVYGPISLVKGSSRR